MTDLQVLLDEWDDSLSVHDLNDAEAIIDLLRAEILVKADELNELHSELRYYRKDMNDKFIQDQGLDDEPQR